MLRELQIVFMVAMTAALIAVGTQQFAEAELQAYLLRQRIEYEIGR